MSSKPYKIWFDGKLVPWNEAKVHVLTHTLHYGLGVFEGIRVYECQDGRAAVFRLTDHINRLYSSAKIAQIEIPFSKEEMRKAIFDLLVVNRFKEAYIRPIAFIGDGAMGVHPRNNPIRVAIAAYPWGAYLGDEAVTKGIRAKISSYTRMHVNTFMTKAKISGNYVNSVMAKLEVTSLGFDEKINQVATERFTRDELYIADEAFLTGTAAEITPIREVDGRIIGDGVPGPVTRRLQERFFDVVRGKDEKFINWLDFVP